SVLDRVPERTSDARVPRKPRYRRGDPSRAHHHGPARRRASTGVSTLARVLRRDSGAHRPGVFERCVEGRDGMVWIAPRLLLTTKAGRVHPPVDPLTRE